MNATRRKAIGVARNNLTLAKAILEQARDEEQEYLDTMPESLQGGEPGDTAQTNVDALDEIVSALDDFECMEF